MRPAPDARTAAGLSGPATIAPLLTAEDTMQVFTEKEAELLVLTRKEGLLSRLGHDLKLAAGRFRIEIDEAGRRVEASCEAASLRVVCALRDGRDDPGELSPGDQADINQKLQRDVLDVAHHPTIRLQGTAEPAGDGYKLTGTLTLHGKSREVTVPVRRSDQQLVAELEVHQPDYGIKPFSAALGALKVAADVRIQVRLPARAAGQP